MRLFLRLLPVLLGCAGSALAADLYRFETEIPIGGEGGWDILTVDSASSRLYLSHASKVVVVDLTNNRIAGEIADTPGVHAFVAIPELNRGFSSNGKEGKAGVVDLKNLQTTGKVDCGQNPDAVLHEPRRSEIYVFNHSGNSATVIDAKSARVVATIPLGGSPEFAVADTTAGRVYCNIEDKSETVAIDTAKHEVVARWPLAPEAEPTGIALEPATHRLFVACHNRQMVMLDTSTGKIVASVPIGAGTDGCAFDPKTRLVFASCGEGTTTIAHEDGDKLNLVQTLPTERGARTMALDTKTHRIYLPSAKFDPAPTPGTRPTIVPNTFKVLVYQLAEATAPK